MRWRASGRLGVLAVAVAAVASACRTRDTGAVHDTSVQAGIESLAVANPAFGGATDANVVASLQTIHGGEVAAGELAAGRATSRAVADYARQMVRDHGSLRRGLDSLAARVNVAPEVTADVARMDTVARVSRDSLAATARGATFDRAYVAHEIAEHRSALEKLTELSRNARNEQLRAHVDSLIPAFRGHLERALALQGTAAPR